MKITREEIRHVANLAKLELKDTEMDTFLDQVGDILGYIKKLDQINTKDVSLTSHAVSMTNAFREDEEHDSPGAEKGLANAPKKEDGFFIVPKIVG